MRQASGAPTGLSTRTSTRQLRSVKSGLGSVAREPAQVSQLQPPQSHSSPLRKTRSSPQNPHAAQQLHQQQQQQQQQQQDGMPSATVIEKLMKQSAEGQDVSPHLSDLKRAILLDGIETDDTGMSPHRIYIWLILLQAPFIEYSQYASYLARGASPSYSKINDDVHRTLATDPLFLRRVSQNSISRILNSMAWAIYDKAPSTPNPSTTEADPFDSPSAAVVVDPAASDPSLIPLPASPGRNRASPYVQGMNVLAAPLLYVSRSEPQAFTLLHTLLTREIPSYVLPTMSGVHTGLSLLDCCLSILDPQLHTHLTSHSLHASTYAFPPIATLSACTPPLPEVLKLWDFFFAYGVHLNVLAVAAQLIMMRERLLGSESPGRELRTLDRLDSRKVVEMVLSFVGKVGGTVYKEIAAHTHTK